MDAPVAEFVTRSDVLNNYDNLKFFFKGAVSLPLLLEIMWVQSTLNETARIQSE